MANGGMGGLLFRPTKQQQQSVLRRSTTREDGEDRSTGGQSRPREVQENTATWSDPNNSPLGHFIRDVGNVWEDVQSGKRELLPEPKAASRQIPSLGGQEGIQPAQDAARGQASTQAVQDN